MSEEVQQSHGSFSSGLILGVLVGAVGYFISQTKEGKQMRETFTDHWHELKDTLVEDGVITGDEPEITHFIQGIKVKIAEFLGESLDDDTNSKQTKKKQKKTRKKKLFKGI